MSKPIYIPSKGRYDSRLTMKALDMMSVPYFVIVEAQEFDLYAESIPEDRLLTLDPAFQREYDACMTLTSDQSRGSGPARNFAWEHARSHGHDWHWVIDDNIRWFNRLHNNRKRRCISPGYFQAMEDFVARYENIAMAGPNYRFFANQRETLPPFYLNTRIYSCNLIRTDVPFQWRGRYNEDTILSLDMLKAGWCTVLFNAFLTDKLATQTLRGGNTDEIYKDGTTEKSEMLVREHPDVARVVKRYGRVHHDVDYSPFLATRLKMRADVEIDCTPNEYGMRLVTLDRQTPKIDTGATIR